MAINRPLRIALWLTAIVSAVVFAHELVTNTGIYRYNSAVHSELYDGAATHHGDFGVFAKAYLATREGRIDEARELYGAIDRTAHPSLRADVLFNLGNTYMRQALAYDPEQQRDLALPLLELAKVAFRDALGADSERWDARMNLIIALKHLPDTPDEQPQTLEFDTGAVRTIISADTEENLP